MRNIFIVVTFLIILSSCSKSTSNTSAASVTNPIMPLKTGNTWVYQDSIWDASGNLLENYADTSFITTPTITISGITFYTINDSLGYFGTGTLLALDPGNMVIYQLDSLNASTVYIFFEIASSDNYLLGTGQDLSNSNCTGTYYAYGFASTFNVDGYSCYKNVDYEKDCNGNILEQDVFYVSPNVGIVRIEDYLPVSTGSSTLYLDWAETLKSAKLN